MKRFTILGRQVEGEVYQRILDLAFNVCEEFILVIRDNLQGIDGSGQICTKKSNNEQYNKSAHDFIEELKPNLIRIEKQFYYPDELTLEIINTLPEYEQKHDVYYFKTNETTKKIISNKINSLFGWYGESLPEDLGFVKKGNGWLETTGHEYEGYFFDLTKDELNYLSKIEGLRLSEHEEKPRVQRVY